MYDRPMFRIGLLLIILAGPAFGASDDIAVCSQRTGEPSLAACTRLLNSSQTAGQAYQLYVARAVTLSRMRYLDAAIGDYTSAITLSDQAFLHLERGDAYFNKGDFVAAYVDYQIVSSREPNNLAARTGMERASEKITAANQSNQPKPPVSASPPTSGEREPDGMNWSHFGFSLAIGWLFRAVAAIFIFATLMLTLAFYMIGRLRRELHQTRSASTVIAMPLPDEAPVVEEEAAPATLAKVIARSDPNPPAPPKEELSGIHY